MDPTVEAYERGLRACIEREGKYQDAPLETFAVKPHELKVLMWKAGGATLVEKRGEDFFCGNVRLVPDVNAFTVRQDQPSPNQKPDPRVQRHMVVQEFLLAHCDAYEAQHGRVPERVFLSPEAMRDYLATVPLFGPGLERYNDTGEISLCHGSRDRETIIQEDPDLSGEEIRSLP